MHHSVRPGHSRVSWLTDGPSPTRLLDSDSANKPGSPAGRRGAMLLATAHLHLLHSSADGNCACSEAGSAFEGSALSSARNRRLTCQGWGTATTGRRFGRKPVQLVTEAALPACPSVLLHHCWELRVQGMLPSIGQHTSMPRLLGKPVNVQSASQSAAPACDPSQCCACATSTAPHPACLPLLLPARQPRAAQSAWHTPAPGGGWVGGGWH